MGARGFFTVVFASVIVLVANATTVHAQTDITVTLNEDGTGTIDVGAGPDSITGTLQPDPGPGGLPFALTFTLEGGSGDREFSLEATPGDVFLFGTENPFTLSDVVRFNSNGAGAASNALFYSLPGGGELADTGFPTQSYANNIGMPEGPNGVTTYTPGAGQPGFIADATTTYVFNSPELVPEPSSLIMLSLGGALLFPALRRSRKR